MSSPGKNTKRPIDRVHHVESEMHPVDAVVDRRFPFRALRNRIQKATKALETALGPRRDLWLRLEEPLNELRSEREDAYFDLGYEHGFAEGRARFRKMAPAVRDLAARMRDGAIQHAAARDEALVALLEAAVSLAIEALAARPPKK